MDLGFHSWEDFWIGNIDLLCILPREWCTNKLRKEETERKRKMRFLGHAAQWRSAAKEALDRTSITVNFLCWLHFTSNYLCSPFHAYGVSMLPTLNVTGDILLADHLSPLLGNVGHGDLVLVRSPLNPKIRLTKRVVAVEGDTVTYFDPLHSEASQVAVVPKGHVWIQGDNIYASRDSRHFGPVPYGLIEGKVFFRELCIVNIA
ncbi:mitochondrial inner membrane protease subunit 1 isoform X2 [Vigna unguiculata]|uniref:mitochondrial inner membrane protease subunit 1 isoform X2 n=1 Tax=Vigna unguiculata TaxID=3917 RepID=UPI0010161680|nr:mitochondrial inner membrane protease subunit 1 isoform X2 [Vigna unguiculata]